MFDLLELVEVDGCVAKLSKQLERADYLKVAQVLEIIGGKWNSKLKGHLFSYNPQEAIQQILDTKTIPPKNPYAFFPTPNNLIEDMLAISNLNNFFPSEAVILESSIGDGAIARFLRNSGYKNKVVGYEVDSFRASIARKIENVVVFEEDFLKADITESFDYALINPPFSLDGNPKAYIDFVYKTWDCIRTGGKLVAVIPSGFLNGGIKKVNEFKEFVHEHGIYYENPKEAFKASGTLVSTCLICLEKRSTQELDELFNKSYSGYPNFFIYLLITVLDSDYKLYHEAIKLKNIADHSEFCLQVRRIVVQLVELVRKDEGWMPFREEWLSFFNEELKQYGS